MAGNLPASSADSRLPYLCSRVAAPVAPTPGAPGTLSEGSPRKAMKSGTCIGSTPYRARTSFGTYARHLARADWIENGGAVGGKLERVAVAARNETVPPRFSSFAAAAARKSSASKPGAFAF